MRLQLFLKRGQWPNSWNKCILMSKSCTPLRLEIRDPRRDPTAMLKIITLPREMRTRPVPIGAGIKVEKRC